MACMSSVVNIGGAVQVSFELGGTEPTNGVKVRLTPFGEDSNVTLTFSEAKLLVNALEHAVCYQYTSSSDF